MDFSLIFINIQTNFSCSNVTPVGVAVSFHEIVYLANIIALL